MTGTRPPLVDGSNPFLATKRKPGKAQPMPDLDDYMTTEEASKALGVHVVTIRKMVAKKKLQSLKVGTVLLIPKTSIERYRQATAGMDKNDPRRGRQE